MSLLDDLASSCRRRGLKLRLTAVAPCGLSQPGLWVDGLEVRTQSNYLLARVPIDGMADDLKLDNAAFDLATDLVKALDE